MRKIDGLEDRVVAESGGLEDTSTLSKTLGTSRVGKSVIRHVDTNVDAARLVACATGSPHLVFIAIRRGRGEGMAHSTAMIGAMKAIVIASVLLAGGVWADEVTDRAAIENAIRTLGTMPGQDSLYTSDFDRDELAPFGKVPNPEGRPIPLTREGVHGTVPVTVKKIRFITHAVAIVDVVRNGPALIVMRKVGPDWKIASVRRLKED